ncbi:MAG: hypothetical protein JWO07_714 [Candidatus Saccharibacteria bacterium]|nr:hypothetical protein [Candidatus Saccharibacteria bacterium]
MHTAAKPFVVLSHAVGTIQPDDSQQERLEEFTNRITSGEFHKQTDARIVCDCVDGRCGAAGALMPNAAGGSESITVADDLTTKSFQLGPDDSTLDQYKATLAFLNRNDEPIGGHTCEGIGNDASGCAANDKLPAVYSFMAQHGDVLRDLAEQLGVKINEQTHLLITSNASARDEFSNGPDLLDALRSQSGSRVSTLKGSHREVLVAVNTKFGTTLDRDAVADEFGDNYQAFNVDVWAFPESAKLCSYFGGDHEADQKVAAMVYYNLAVAHVIGGKNLRVVVVK